MTSEIKVTFVVPDGFPRDKFERALGVFASHVGVKVRSVGLRRELRRDRKTDNKMFSDGFMQGLVDHIQGIPGEVLLKDLYPRKPFKRGRMEMLVFRDGMLLLKVLSLVKNL